MMATSFSPDSKDYEKMIINLSQPNLETVPPNSNQNYNKLHDTISAVSSSTPQNNGNNN